MTTIRAALIALALALPGCASDELSVVLTPDTPEIAAVLHEADARWEQAGVAPGRIVISEGGAPVRVALLGHTDDGPIHGVTGARKRGAEYTGVSAIDLATLDLPAVIHEMGHALGIAVGFGPHPLENTGACDLDAPNRPVMCAVIGSVITELDLAEACSAGECTHFTPEAH